MWFHDNPICHQFLHLCSENVECEKMNFKDNVFDISIPLDVKYPVMTIMTIHNLR